MRGEDTAGNQTNRGNDDLGLSRRRAKSSRPIPTQADWPDIAVPLAVNRQQEREACRM